MPGRLEFFSTMKALSITPVRIDWLWEHNELPNSDVRFDHSEDTFNLLIGGTADRTTLPQGLEFDRARLNH